MSRDQNISNDLMQPFSCHWRCATPCESSDWIGTQLRLRGPHQ